MTKLRVYEEEDVRVVPAMEPAHEMSFQDLMTLAKELVPTGFLPDHIKTAGQFVAVVLTGRELGMKPMRALRSLRMVKGNVTEMADSQLSRFKKEGGHSVWKRLDAVEATIQLRHPNGDEHEETFTIQDAEMAGLLRPSPRTGEPSMFLKYPKPMLASRAITAGLKRMGWEGGSGIYDPDEALTFSGSDASPAKPALTPSRGDEPAERNVGWQAMTLDEALRTPLRGPTDKWGGHGQQPLGVIPYSLVVRALAFFVDKLEKRPDDDSLARQVRALELVQDARAGEAKPKKEEEPEEDAEEDDAPPASAKERATPVSSRTGPLAIPEDMAELKRWSAAQLQATIIESLKDPALAVVRVDFLEQVNAGISHKQGQSILTAIAGMLDLARAKPKRDARGDIGTLPGEYDEDARP